MLEILDRAQATAAGLDWPDVYFTPGYGGAAEQSDHAQWRVAVWDGGAILYPFLQRRIDPELGIGGGRFDVVSPYGYPGTWGRPQLSNEEWRAFRDSVRRELPARGAVAEYQRLSPFVHGRGPLLACDPTLEARRRTDVYALDLGDGYDACSAAMHGRTRTKTRKAQRLGYHVEVRVAEHSDLVAGAPFRALYEATMQRVGATDYYQMGEGYFAALQRGLGDHLHLVEVHDPLGAQVAAALFMTWGSWVHLHLTATAPAAARDGVGNLLYDAVLRWGCQQRYAHCNIGGGISAGDSLSYFKQGFGGRAEPVWTARSVLDHAAYAAAVRRRAELLQVERTVLDHADYFPAYRAGATDAQIVVGDRKEAATRG